MLSLIWFLRQWISPLSNWVFQFLNICKQVQQIQQQNKTKDQLCLFLNKLIFAVLMTISFDLSVLKIRANNLVTYDIKKYFLLRHKQFIKYFPKVKSNVSCRRGNLSIWLGNQLVFWLSASCCFLNTGSWSIKRKDWKR